MTDRQLIQEAMRHHQAGRLAQAETLYHRAVQSNPRNADALNLLGVLARQREQFDRAVEWVEKAIALRRNVSDFHFNLGESCRSLGNLERAEAAYNKAT